MRRVEAGASEPGGKLGVRRPTTASVIAQSLNLGTHPHTLVTKSPPELRAALNGPSSSALTCGYYRTGRPVMARPMIIRWISEVPSKIVKILASRCQRSTG